MFDYCRGRQSARGYALADILHVAQSQYHDIAVAKSLGYEVCWVERRSGDEGWGATPVPQDVTTITSDRSASSPTQWTCELATAALDRPGRLPSQPRLPAGCERRCPQHADPCRDQPRLPSPSSKPRSSSSRLVVAPCRNGHSMQVLVLRSCRRLPIGEQRACWPVHLDSQRTAYFDRVVGAGPPHRDG